MVNLFGWFVSSEFYTSWSIRTRNQMYYALLGREVNRERAEQAEMIAEGVVRWLRPLVMVVLNLLLAYLLFASMSGPKRPAIQLHTTQDVRQPDR